MNIERAGLGERGEREESDTLGMYWLGERGLGGIYEGQDSRTRKTGDI